MELYDVMRTTFAAREFTDAPLQDEILFKILENARFAPSGGNRQAGHVIIVRDRATRQEIADLSAKGAKRYVAQMAAGESPWNTIEPTSVDTDTIENTPVPRMFTEIYLKAAVLLIVCVDLKLVASLDQYLDRVGMVAGASVYPLVWNILMAARNEGFGGTLTTMPIAEEPRLKTILEIPEHVAVSAIIPLGEPVRQLKKLKRVAVSSFTSMEGWNGDPLAEV